MKKIICFFALLVLCDSVCAKQVTVPKNTNIDISINKVISSRRVPKTYEIKSTIKDDVIIDGVTVFCENDPAIIEIGEVEKAKGFGRSGRISVVGGFAVDANGQSRRFIFDRDFKADDDIWATRWIPFNKGKQAFIYPSNVFVVQTKRAFVFKEEAPTTKNQEYINPTRPPKKGSYGTTNVYSGNSNRQYGLVNVNHN